MKKLVMFFMITIMFVAFLGSQMVRAESYQRWITFGQPGHIMTANELADITGALGDGKIFSDKTYRLSTGITYKIPQPDLFFEYIIMCVKEGEPSISTTNDVVREIQNGEVVRWGNDISVRVKNYYFSSLHNRVQFINNYSGNDVADGVFVLLIHGNPKIKMDCGNPLWVIGGGIIKRIPPLEPEPKPAPDGFRKTNVDELDYTSSIIIKKVPEEYIDPNKMFVTETIRTKTWFGRHWGWFAGVLVGSGLTIGGIYLHNNHHHHDDGGPGGAPKTPPDDDGDPGGAPKTPPPVVPPVVPPVIIPPVVVPGGPGGAPKTP